MQIYSFHACHPWHGDATMIRHSVLIEEAGSLPYKADPSNTAGTPSNTAGTKSNTPRHRSLDVHGDSSER